MVLGTTIADCCDCHHKYGDNGHLSARVSARPLLRGVANAKKGVENGENEAKDIAENQCVLHARESVASVHDEVPP